MNKNKIRLLSGVISIFIIGLLIFSYYKINESKNALLPSWSKELILTYNNDKYIVTDEKTKEMDKKIGIVTYHGKVSGAFQLYSIKNINPLSKIAVRTKEGYLVADKDK